LIAIESINIFKLKERIFVESFDLAIAYTWEYDKELVLLIEKVFHSLGLKTFLISDFNLDEVCERVEDNSIHFKALLDRASDEDAKYLCMPKILSRKGTYIINPIKKTLIATDKAKVYRKLKKLKIRTPYSYIIPSYNENSDFLVEPSIITKLGIPFVVKPATFSGGGQAVFMNANDINDISSARQDIPQDKFLLQKMIYPPLNGRRRLWFRCYWFFGNAFPVWWDDQTHIYNNISKVDYKKFRIYKLVSVTRKLAQISSLDYFSTEATIDEKNNFILIDYINDQCDFRLKSNHADGVPDRIVKFFIKNMARKIQKLK